MPCNILTGPLGAGKSTAILKLLQTHGDGSWAVLVNEMGDVGIDGVIAESGGAATAQVSGGCICCANGVAVRVALTRLLRQRPSRLLIEPSGLGHVAELCERLQAEPLCQAVELRAVACVIPCSNHDKLWAEAPLYRDMVHASDVLILNRRDVDAKATLATDAWAAQLYPPKATLIADRGACSTTWIDAPRDAVAIEQEHAPGAEADDEYRPKRTFTHLDGSKRTESHGGGRAYVGVIFGRTSQPFEVPKGQYINVSRVFRNDKLKGKSLLAFAEYLVIDPDLYAISATDYSSSANWEKTPYKPGLKRASGVTVVRFDSRSGNWTNVTTHPRARRAHDY